MRVQQRNIIEMPTISDLVFCIGIASGFQLRSWDEAYKLAQNAVSSLSLQEQVNLATGTGWGNGPCVGNIGRVNVKNFNGLCLQDSPTGVRFANNASAFPASINLAATFDRSLFLAHGEKMGEEVRGKGVHLHLGPDTNIMRVPNGGRNWETQGADPYLAAESARLQIRGVQSQGVQSTIKHFLLNEQEVNRYSSSSNVDDRTLHEIYLKPFAAAIDEGVAAIMCSYNSINGTNACENPIALGKILRDQLGFRGLVMTDWDASKNTDRPVMAGTDMNMPGGNGIWGNNLLNAVYQNRIPASRVAEMATRILAAWYKAGQDQDYPPVTLNSFGQEFKAVNVQGDHAEHIRKVGAASSILLKNVGNSLPLKSNLKIAVIGSDAGAGDLTSNKCPDHACSSGVIAQGWGSGTTNFPYIITPLDGITKRASKSSSQVVSSLNDYDLNTAGSLARSSDVVIVFVSANSGEEYLTVNGNRGDRNDLNLWNNGDNLINAATQNSKKVIVVIHGPGAVNMPWIDNPAVVGVIHALYPGQEAGNSIADVLFGDVNPSGRLPFTINKNPSDYCALVSFNNQQINYAEGLLVDYRWNDAKGISPLYEFGFGLSYTTFEYSGFIAKVNRDVSVDFTVKNTGPLDGHEVVQLYLGFPATAGEPPKQLKDFDRKMIQKGQSVPFQLYLKRKEMMIWNSASQSWIMPLGEYTLFVGSSSRNIKWSFSFTS